MKNALFTILAFAPMIIWLAVSVIVGASIGGSIEHVSLNLLAGTNEPIQAMVACTIFALADFGWKFLPVIVIPPFALFIWRFNQSV
jgi:hypothetical protein